MHAGPRSAQEREVEMVSDSSRNRGVERQLAGALAEPVRIFVGEAVEQRVIRAPA